jgi:GT2 family glycosyltransferase/glycosyltransferase involved in cell wall biosynthesis
VDPRAPEAEPVSGSARIDLQLSQKRIGAAFVDTLEARKRLARVRSDYLIIERSKFSRARSLWLILKSLLGLSSKRDAFAAISHSDGLAASSGNLELPSEAGLMSLDDVVAAFSRRSVVSASESPTVSIVIPVYDHIDVTLRCLFSIAATWFDSLRVEIIVVDDGSTDGTAAVLNKIPGITVLSNGINEGFVRSCNRGASIARGQYLCFLNNDTEVRNAWLDYLVVTAASHPNVGAVGSKLLYPDGRLQEAGNIVWRDGSAWNYGRGEDPEDPLFNFVREVDYSSGASLLVRSDFFRNVGGFSPEFSPAYYEDVDLCFALRQRGYKVLYDPRSQVVHHEGVSSGTDTSAGTKRFQEINRFKFVQRRREQLDSHFENDAANVYRAARRLPERPGVMVVDSYVPRYDREAGSARMFEIVKIVNRLGFRVVFMPDNFSRIEPYTSELQGLGVEVLHHVAQGRSPQARFEEALRRIDIAWISRPELFEKWAAHFRERGIPVVYDTVDLHHVRLRRQAVLEGNRDDESWKAVEAMELSCALAAKATVTVSVQEKETLEAAGIRNVTVVPTIHDPKIGSREFSASSGLLFIGGYRHAPNVDAVNWLCSEIMPLVWREHPELKLTLLGDDPPPAIAALASARVAVPGFVSDVAPYFMSHRLFVAPLRYGAGHKGKIGQSLSYGLPVVTSSIGAEGFNLRDSDDYLHAETAFEFAKAIVRLYSDPALWSKLSENALLALRPFSSEVATDAIFRLMESVAQGEPVLTRK